jgi:hypothetical protein
MKSKTKMNVTAMRSTRTQSTFLERRATSDEPMPKMDNTQATKAEKCPISMIICFQAE